MKLSDPNDTAPAHAEREGESSARINDRDRQLITRIQRRDASALVELYDRDSSSVYGVLLRMVGDETAAQESLQQVFVDLWNGAFDGDRTPLLVSLVTIARRIATERRASGGALTSAAVAPTDRQTLAIPTEDRELLTTLYFDHRGLEEIAAAAKMDVDELRARAVAAMQTLRKSDTDEAWGR